MPNTVLANSYWVSVYNVYQCQGMPINDNDWLQLAYVTVWAKTRLVRTCQYFKKYHFKKFNWK